MEKNNYPLVSSHFSSIYDMIYLMIFFSRFVSILVTITNERLSSLTSFELSLFVFFGGGVGVGLLTTTVILVRTQCCRYYLAP